MFSEGEIREKNPSDGLQATCQKNISAPEDGRTPRDSAKATIRIKEVTLEEEGR
jgi:hypothetical protein